MTGRSILARSFHTRKLDLKICIGQIFKNSP